MRLIVALLAIAAAPVCAQVPCTSPVANCPAGGPNAATLCWTHDGSGSVGQFKAYYGLNGALTSTALVTGASVRTMTLTGLAPGLYTFAVSALGGGGESPKSCTATKQVMAATVPPPVTPTPTTLTVSSTRIDAAEWTCRDAAGVILSSHTRQDTAQTACTNLALKNPGKVYELRPSGYRISAQ